RDALKVTIVVAIHQPRPEVWELFSHTILVKSGRVVYCGPAVDALDGISRCEAQFYRLFLGRKD
ncbi:unnamed protein product, partial [Laminaria digitata]